MNSLCGEWKNICVKYLASSVVSVESDRRERGFSPQQDQLRRDVCVVVRGWCMAIKSFGKGQEAVVLSWASVVGAFCYQRHLCGEKDSWLGAVAWVKTLCWFVSEPVQH